MGSKKLLWTTGMAIALGVAGCRMFSGEDARQYCIIDLSSGPQGKSYPVSFSSSMPQDDEAKLTKLVLKRIPAGTFKMCGVADVTISKPFYIGVYHVTRRQYQLVEGKRVVAIDSGAYTEIYDKHPALYVSYEKLRGRNLGSKWPASSEVDEDSFIGKLRARTGVFGLDLPTEAQFEYACRAGTTNLYHNGGDTAADLNKIACYAGNPVKNGEVGSYQPNNWGLYDMQGSAYQWCLDWGPWKITQSTDPKGNPTGRTRCLRGGCFLYRADECTSKFRYYDCGTPANESAYFSFRLCCPADVLESACED